MVTREILVIDDDTLTRWSLAKVLARAGYRVRGAASAAEGLAKAGESQPDLPVMVMSARATLRTVWHPCRLGAHGFLERPCAAVLLQAQVAHLL
jgi:DNA-binding NtrC family response regulator